MIHYSPLRYPGGKNCIFPFVSKLYYENNLIGIDYAEPYAGGAGLALRLLIEGYTNRIYINDLDISIYSFWKTIFEHTEDFCEWIGSVPININQWKQFKAILDNKIHYSQFELAQATFYLNRTNVSGVLKGGIIGGLNQNGNFKMDARFNKSDLINRINVIANYKNHVVVSKMDGIDFIKSINRIKRPIFVNIDPPYFQKGADLYMNYYISQDHINLSKTIKKLNKSWMVTYDNNEFIINLYRKFNIINHSLSQSTSNRIGEELVIFCDNISYEYSSKFLKSPILLT